MGEDRADYFCLSLLNCYAGFQPCLPAGHWDQMNALTAHGQLPDLGAVLVHFSR